MNKKTTNVPKTQIFTLIEIPQYFIVEISQYKSFTAKIGSFLIREPL